MINTLQSTGLKLSLAQQIFSVNIAKLIMYANEMGYGITFGEAFRTQYQQDYYVQKGLSKTKNSLHLNRLAIDLNIFINGKYTEDNFYYKALGNFWESINKLNQAGSLWNWDNNHFEMHFIE